MVHGMCSETQNVSIIDFFESIDFEQQAPVSAPRRLANGATAAVPPSALGTFLLPCAVANDLQRSNDINDI